MEELVENIPGARVVSTAFLDLSVSLLFQVFERWMEWEPNEQGWQTYINFELRYKEIDRARSIYQRFLHVHGHDYKNWIRYAKFEERHGYIGNARAVRFCAILELVEAIPGNLACYDLMNVICGNYPWQSYAVLPKS